MSSKEFGSIEALNQRASRTSLLSTSSADDVLDKLKYLNYHVDFCKQHNIHPLHKFQLLYPSPNPNEQFYIFSLLFTFVVTKQGQSFEKPGQFDDPNATCANMVACLKNMGISFDYPPVKLKQGYGDACIHALSSIIDLFPMQFQSPLHKTDDYPEDAEVDDDAEVTTEMEVEANDEEDEVYVSKLQVNKEQTPAVVFDPSEWRLEVERVTPLLKVKLSNEKDWRLHIQQIEYHQEKITANMTETHTRLFRLVQDIEQGLEKITSREKYINAQFESKTDEYKKVSESLSETKQKFANASTSVCELSNELSRISEELDQVKTRMDELGNGMTDSKPLLAIKQGTVKLKDEIKQMDLRIGVIENTLLGAKMKKKDTLQNDFAVHVFSYY